MRDICGFLNGGKLDPVQTRLPKASSLMATFYIQFRGLHQHKGLNVVMLPEIYDKVCPPLKRFAFSLSNELLSPLRTKFFQDIFAHKHFSVKRHVCCHNISLLSCLHVVCAVL